MTDQAPDQRPQRDLATEGMEIRALETMIEDCRNQPVWRPRANLCAEFYDGWQLSQARQAELEDAGIPVSVTNLIGRTVNGALGTEAKARLNWKLAADDDDFSDVATAVSAKLSEAQRETYADMAISDAYKDQLISLGWVEVSRQPDPLLYPYRVEHVHRNEIWWDWRARRKDLKDARWLVRQRWGDLDELKAKLPQHKGILKQLVNAGSSISDAFDLSDRIISDMQHADGLRTGFRVPREEWLDTTRSRIRLYEVWYRVPTRVTVMIDRNGLRRKFDKTNEIHVMAASRGLVQLVSGPSWILRKAIFAGPYRLSDKATNQDNFPYIPFWCYRTDADRAPYGIVDGMISPQEEYNERRSKLRWLLRAAQVFVDNDALDTRYNNYLDLASEIMRPDATVILNATRRNGQGVRVEHNLQLAAEQVNVMNDAKQLVQEVPGIYSTMLGDAPSGVTSGLAINSLVEQSLVALGETNDNYRMGRRLVGEALVQLIVEDMRQPNMRVVTGKGKTKRTIILNTIDPATQEPTNQVAAAPLKTGLDDVPSTPAHRMQQQQELGKVIQATGSDPDCMAILMPAFIRATDLPNKDEMADWLCRRKGVPISGETDPSADDQQQAQQQQAAQMQQQAQMAEFQAKLKDLEASVAQKLSAAELNKAKAEATRVDTAIAAATPPAAATAPNPDDAIAQSLASID